MAPELSPDKSDYGFLYYIAHSSGPNAGAVLLRHEHSALNGKTPEEFVGASRAHTLVSLFFPAPGASRNTSRPSLFPRAFTSSLSRKKPDSSAPRPEVRRRAFVRAIAFEGVRVSLGRCTLWSRVNGKPGKMAPRVAPFKVDSP
jgi:hypothetical protein